MKEKSSSSGDDRNTLSIMRSIRVLAYLALTGAFSVYIIWFNIVNKREISSSPDDWASFGDFFGGTVGPFIGFASIVLLVETLKLQQRGLKEQREQLQRSAEEVAQQNKILVLQGFEQSFFAWLKDYKEQMNEFTIAVLPDQKGNQQEYVHGRQAVQHLINHCLNPIGLAGGFYGTLPTKLAAAVDRNLNSDDLEFGLKNVRERWQANMDLYADWLGSMLRTLYGLFRWIDRHNQLNTEEKQHYASIVRARLSNAELRMLFINGMTPAGLKFAQYINKYSLFDNLPNPDMPVLDVIKRHQECPYTQLAYSTKHSDEFIHSKSLQD